MKTSARTSRDDILQQAAEWFAVMHAGDASADARRRWQAWMGADGSPQRHAWSQVERISQHFGSVCDPAARSALHGTVDQPRRAVLRTIAAVGGAGMLAWAGRNTSAWQNLHADYHAGTGEIREVTLDDGSSMWLDTDSAADVAFTAAWRRISLLRGDIRITTAATSPGARPDGRPLTVQGSHGRMLALGTDFSIRQRQNDTLLSVFAGAVEIQPTNAAPRTLQAGTQARFNRHGIGPEQPADPMRKFWTQGLLVAADMPLRAFAQELGRYRHGRLDCDDAVAALPLVGVYSLRDTDQALDALAQALPVRIRRRTRWWVTIQAA